MSEIEIIHEDEFVLVVNKPAGLGTQAPRQFDSLEARVRSYLAETATLDRTPYLGIPHRLDRCVSGVVVLAKRKKSAQRLARQFERREVEKSYRAIVEGQPEPSVGEWRDHLRKVPDEPRAEIVSPGDEGAKLAVLQYRVESVGTNKSVGTNTSQLVIKLETGRMHQIRIQCASRGHAVLGDVLYGSEFSFGKAYEHDRDRQIALHAEELVFEHPRTRDRVAYRAQLPEAWQYSG